MERERKISRFVAVVLHARDKLQFLHVPHDSCQVAFGLKQQCYAAGTTIEYRPCDGPIPCSWSLHECLKALVVSEVNSELKQVGGPNLQNPKKANTNYEPPPPLRSFLHSPITSPLLSQRMLLITLYFNTC
jgi:hypothetical protein